MKADLMRWILFFFMTGKNVKPGVVQCGWGQLDNNPLVVTLPETSPYKNNPRVLEIMKELDPNAFHQFGDYIMVNPVIPTEILRENLPFESDVLPCKRNEFEFLLRVDL